MRDASALQELAHVPCSQLRRIDGRIKVALACLLVGILAWIPENEPAATVRLGGLLLVLALAGRVPLRALLVRMAPLAPFVLVILFIPFLHHGGEEYSVPFLPGISAGGLSKASSILLRMFAIGGTMALLAATTPFDDILKALRYFRVPAGVVQGLGVLFRYLYLLLDETQRMLRAHASRGGDWRPGSLMRQSIGALVGVLFLRAYARGERVFRAMCARGYDGYWEPMAEPPPSLRQVAGGVLLGAVVIALRWFRGGYG